MRFSEFKQYQPKQPSNVFGFVCEDDFLLEESRPVWQRIFGGTWVFEKYPVKEFEEISRERLMDDALTPSLFTQNRIIIVTNAEKTTKGRLEVLSALQSVANASLRIVLAASSRKATDSWVKIFPVIEIDALKSADVARWLMDRYKLAPDIARYLVDNVGTDLYQLNTEMQKLQTYVGGTRAIEVRDVDILILRSEQYAPFELDDAILGRDYKRAVQVLGAMLDDGLEPLIVLSRIVRVWRQLFVGKSLVGKRSAKDVAAAALVPPFKAADFTASCKEFDWKQLAGGFRLLLNADRAFKTSTPNPEAYFDIMLWKMMN
ncbi:MAG TPA: DNA polymerase III subunit delta [Terriglobia bacterium]|nr:DNA polymerase III subunit delta [Terriglobia bacterium]